MIAIYFLIAAVVIGYCAFSRFALRGLVVYLIYLTCIEGVLKQMAKTNNSLTFLIYPVRDIAIFVLLFKAYLLEKNPGAVGDLRRQGMGIPVKLCLLLFISWCIFQVFLNMLASGNSFIGLISIRPYLEWLPLFFLAYRYMIKEKYYLVFSSVFLVCVSLNAIAATIQYIKGPDWLAGLSSGYEYFVNEQFRSFSAGNREMLLRPPGLGNDAGFSGILSYLAVPFLFYSFISLYKTKTDLSKNVFLLCAAMCVVAGIISSLSRTAVIIFAVTVIIMIRVLLRAKTRGKMIIINATMILIVTFAIWYAYSPDFFVRYKSIATPEKVISTMTSTEGFRWKRIRNLPNVLLRFPLGAGLGKVGSAGSFIDRADMSSQPSTGIPFAENQIEYTALDLGLPALLAWIMFHIFMLRIVIGMLKKAASAKFRNVVLVLTVTMFILLIHWPFGTLQGMSGAMFWFCSGCILALKSLKNEEAFV